MTSSSESEEDDDSDYNDGQEIKRRRRTVGKRIVFIEGLDRSGIKHGDILFQGACDTLGVVNKIIEVGEGKPSRIAVQMKKGVFVRRASQDRR